MSVPTSSPSDNSNYNCANGKVRIFIRSPTTPSPEDFSVLINLDSSVLALKQAIFETHPQKPIVRDQKLIYRGRVLNDTDTIVNVLRNGLETDQTFHLVVKPSFQAIAETTGIPISPPSSSSQTQQPFAGQIPDPQQDVAARNQRRAATLWLIVKLFFLVYIFSQNASAERMILLYIFALVIFLYQTGRLRIVRRRRQRIIVPMPNELFDQEAQSPTQSDQNNNDPSTSSTSRQSSSSPVLNDNSNNNASSSSSQQQNVNDNNGNNSANEAQPNPQENIRSITWQDIEHAIWTFFTSLIPTNPPDVGQQDEVGM
ncbi:3561_t:CDS:2 [Acaulospora morrowiae]|uniref:3561_t:CDS:1 n=1 Tax=Acaulospora morrowiae TaxID=94023 RepID=A0A9N8ZT53_9GLOM|nr:3561_t:CDS:2 [Acaulospora morrowiae]